METHREHAPDHARQGQAHTSAATSTTAGCAKQGNHAPAPPPAGRLLVPGADAEDAECVAVSKIELVSVVRAKTKSPDIAAAVYCTAAIRKTVGYFYIYTPV